MFKDHRAEGWSERRRYLANIVESHTFDLVMGVLISLNSTMVVLETDAKASSPDEGIPVWISSTTSTLICVYTFELAIRLYVYRGWFFYNSWNCFDFVVVVSDIFTEVMTRLMSDTIPSISVLRIFRLGRLLRFVEVLTMFQELNTMVQLMVSSLRAMFWGLVLLGITLTLWSILAVEILHPLNQRIAAAGVYDSPPCERCSRAFESVAQSNLTLFQTLVFGDNWGQIAMPMIEAEPAVALILVLAGMSVHVGLLNLILTVIVDKAREKHEHDLERKIKLKEKQFQQAKTELISLCESLDEDGSGELSLQELLDGFDKNAQFAMTLSVMDIKKDDMEVVFGILDEDHSGAVTYSEFAEQLHKMKSQDAQTMLIFIKGYVNELRQKVSEQGRFLKNEIFSSLDMQRENVGEVLKCLSQKSMSAKKAADKAYLPSAEKDFVGSGAPSFTAQWRRAAPQQRKLTRWSSSPSSSTTCFKTSRRSWLSG